jgi:uncharacterized protein (TIGR03000 family)
MPVSYGCYGSGCYGGMPVASYGCYSSGWYGGMPVSYGCYGSAYSTSVPFRSGYFYGGPAPVAPVPAGYEVSRPIEVRRDGPQEVRREAPRNAPPVPAKSPPAERIGPPEEAPSAPAPATLKVRLPADAKLTINDRATQATSTTRTFVTPPLQPGKNFSYTLKAEVVRNGQTFTATEQVPLRAGEEKQVLLEFRSARVVRR